MYAVVVSTACFVEDVEIVIKFVGSMANSTLNFTLPGLYYFIIMRKSKASVTPKWKLFLSLLLALYGIIMGIAWTGINIWTSIRPLPEPSEE